MIPPGTKSIGYPANLLQPMSNLNNSEDSFSHCEFELAWVEQDNNTTRTDQVKVAETPEQLQHLQLPTEARQTYAVRKATGIKYIREIIAVSNMQASQQAPSSSRTSYSRGVAPMKEKVTKEKAHRAEA